MKTIAHIEITPSEVVLNDKPLATASQGAEILSELYRQHIDDYPKFFKMDGLCRLGFVASELLLNALGEQRFTERDDRAVVLFNSSGSHDADIKYQATVSEFPSPSVFVYTLPNIITGEIAIRNKYMGETSFYLLEDYDTQQMQHVLQTTFQDAGTTSILTGWIDYVDGTHFHARMEIIEKN